MAVALAAGKCPAGKLLVFGEELRQLLFRLLHGQVELEMVIDDIRLIHIGTDGNRVREGKQAVKTVFTGPVLFCKGGSLQAVAAELRPDKILYGFII